MKLPAFGTFFFVAVIILTSSASSATFTDDMTFAQNAAETQYSGLAPYKGATHGLSDPTMLSFSSISSPLGYAIYRVSGAERITAGIYTFSGTGVSQGERGLTLGQSGLQAYWSRSGDAVYSDFGGSVLRLGFNSQMLLVFSPADTPLPDDLKAYGLNIYASPNLDKPLPMVMTKTFRESDLSYEEYTAAIPSGAQYVKVEINDVTSYPLLNGGFYQNTQAARFTRLASAMISGESLVMGEPAPVVAEQQPNAVQAQAPAPGGEKSDDEQDEQIEPSAENGHKADFQKDTEFEGTAELSSKSSSSSKFEGTITSSSKAASSSPNKNTRSSKEPQSDAPSEKSQSPESGGTDRGAVYEIRREKGGGIVTSGVTAYIIAVTGALVLVLVLGRK